MSEISLFPQYIDIFTPKVNETGDGNGDYILAEHVNLIQNAITSIESSLGTNPQGSNLNVAQRLYELDQNKTLTVPKITLYKGDPKLVNGAANATEAARHFNYFSVVILDDIDPYADAITGAQDTIAATKAIGNTYFYAAIDAGVSTLNLDAALVEDLVARWKDIGAEGIYFKNFGYDYSVSRERQNELVAIAHRNGLRVLVSATNIDDVFGTIDTNGMNPTGEEMNLLSSDGYVALGYATIGEYYVNGAELASISEKMISYRSAYGVSMYAIGYIYGAGSNARAKMYYYGQSVAMAYSLNGYHAINHLGVPQTTQIYRTLPITGNYYEENPIVKRAGNVVTRTGHIGTITVDLDTHTYDFVNIKIPLRFIDMGADNTTIDAGKLSGTIADNVNINVIGRINADATTTKISADKIELNGLDIIDAINTVKDDVVHKISMDAIEDLNAVDIEAIVVEALGNRLENMLQTQNYDVNFDRLTASVVSSLNAYFGKIKAGTVEANGIDAGIVNTGHLNTDIIDANTLTSDKLTIHGNSGLNKWTGVIAPKTPGVVVDPTATHINGKDVYRKVEAVDATGISTSDLIGSSLQNYVVKWETNVYCTAPFAFSGTLGANSNTNLYINNVGIAHCNPNQTTPYGQITLEPGWNLIQVFQDHNTETSCFFDIGVKFSTYSLQTEKGTDTHVARVDAYASQTTQIIGDLIKTGTVEADKLVAHSVTAEQIEAHSLTANEIAAGTITANEINVNDLNAAIVDADLLNAIEAHIQKLSATDGEFERVLADMLTAKFVNANNIKITSEAQDTVNSTGLLSGNTGVLTIDNGGIIVAQNRKGKTDVVNEPMSTTTARVYTTAVKPILNVPEPVFVLKDRTTQATTLLSREQYRLIYEYGQVTLNDDVDIVNKDVVATYSYPETWFPANTRVVKIDKEGLHISNNGGRPGSWTTKLDGNRLYVESADIKNAAIQNAHIDRASVNKLVVTDADVSDLSADKLTAGTIDAAEIDVINLDASNINTGTLTATESMKIQGGNVEIDNTGLTVSGGAGITVNTTEGKTIELDERGLISEKFTIGTDGNVSITGTVNANEGHVGNVTIDADGLVLGEGSIVDTRDTSVQKLYISKSGLAVGNVQVTESGTVINGIQITPQGLQAFTAPTEIVNNITNITNEEYTQVENNEYVTNNYYLQPNSIRVLGDESVIIDTGTLVVKDGLGANRITLGKLADAYGFKLDMDTGRFIQLDPRGMKVYNGTENTIDINSAGNVTITGTINATAGTLGTLTVNGTITAGDTTINTTGISGTGYSLNASGLVTTKGKIGGWDIASNALTTPNIQIESNLELITIASDEVLIGRYDNSATPKYGIKAGGTILDSAGLTMNQGSITLGSTFSVTNAGVVTASSGTIAGWTIGENSISKGTFVLDAVNSKLDLGSGKIVLNADGSATIGKLTVGTDGSVTSTNFSIEADGDVTIAGLTATNGSFSGTINATSGWFGTSTKHVDITGDGLQAGSVTITDTGIKVGTIVEISSAGLILRDVVGGTSSIDMNSLFKVDSAGNVTAKAGTIGGWTLAAGEISNDNIHIDKTNNAIWIGSALASAVIRLNSTGTSNIGKFTINADSSISTGNGFTIGTDGAFSATAGTIAGWTVGASTLAKDTNAVLDSTNYKLSFNNGAAVFGQYTAGKYGLKVGNFEVDGTSSTLSAGTGFSINLATGAATLSGGAIGGWTIGTGKISSTGIELTSGASANIKVTNTDTTKYVQIDAVNGLVIDGSFLNIKIKSGNTDVVKIDSNGIWAGTTANNVTLNGNGITVASTSTVGNVTKKMDITASSITATPDTTKNGRVIFDSDGVKVIKDDNSVGSAITKDGIIGTLITDQSITGSKFDKTPPAVPTGVTVSQVIEQTVTSEFININVSWTAVADTDLAGYKVYLKEGTGLYLPQAVVTKGQTSYVIRNVKGATQYYVAVAAYDVTGNESARSGDTAIMTNKDAIAPANVSGLSYVDGPKMFYIKWNPVTTNTNTTSCVDLDYYEVQRKTEQYAAVVEDWTLINRTYSTGIIDKDVAYDYDYSYRVRAVDLSGNTSVLWTTVIAGKPSKIGAADIVAGSITADVLNIGAMVKGINPNKTILFHYDGVMTSTQDLRPAVFGGGSWVDGKYGNAIALEEATMNLVSEKTAGNAGFNNGTTGWTNSGAVYNSSGGIKGSDDGYVAVTDAGKISITLDTVAGKQYAISVFSRLDDFTKAANVIVKANGVEIMNTSLISEWKRVFYIYTANSTSTTLEFSSSNTNTVCIDSIQVEQRGFITAFTESYNIEDGSTRTGIRPEGIIKYSSEKLNPKGGIVSMWYRPNRVNGSPNTNGQILFIWGTDPNNYYKLEITNDNKPKWTMTSQGLIHTITHQSVVDAMAWNQITVRWSYDPTVSEHYAQLFLNGTPVEDSNRINLTGFVTPDFGATYFTMGNHHDKGYSCNGYLDEVRIDIEALMDDQEREEIISWYKQGSTFYDVASQIDADSQGISASNARIRINSEGITVKDGVIKVIAEDGVTLIGGGRLNVNGINVGVVQSDNEVYNGNFSAKDTLLGTGDMYVDNSGVQFYGAAYWRSRRSSGPTYGNALLQSAWNKHLVNSLMDFGFVRNMIFDTFNTQYRANEAVNHTVENNILPAMYAQGIAGVTATATAVGATSIKTTTLVWQPGMTIYIGSGANREAATIAGIVPGAPHTISFAVGLTKSHAQNEYIVEKTLFDDTLEDELVYQIGKATNAKYDEWINFGVSTVRYNDAKGLNFAAAVRFDSESNTLQYIKHQWDPWARRLSIPTSEIDPATMLPKVYEATEQVGAFGHTIFEVHPVDVLYGKTGYVKLGIDTLDTNYTPHTAYQNVSIEQNLNNLITYTDGLKPTETHWKQQVFTAYVKWNDKPVGSNAKLRFEVDELVPNFDVDEQGMAVPKPTFEMATPDTVFDQNTFLLSNTDFVAQSYQAIIGNATLSSDHKQYTLNNVRYASALPVMKVRYIRDWVNGSSANTAAHWSNIIAVDTTGTPVMVSPAAVTSPTGTITNAAAIVDLDGSFQPNVMTYGSIDVAGPQCVQVDLGSVKNLVQITIHHYFLDGRTYHGTRTQVSEDGYKWFDVYNSVYQGEYAETPQGHTIGGMNGMNPNPIYVQEVLTELGETQQPGWVIKSDGGSIPGMPDSKYLASTTTGDALIMYFNTDSNSDIRFNMVKNTNCGTVSVFVDGMFFGEVDLSYVTNVLYSMDNKNLPAGQHMIVAIATGSPGANTAPGTAHPAFMMESSQWFTWNLLNTTDYTTSVEYEETDTTGWNKIVIKPNKVNDKGSGSPLIQAERVPIKYRVRIELEKPEDDPYSASAYVTGIQAEAGFNESFSRVNYGPADGMPAAILQNYNKEIPLSGITPSKLQEHVPEFIWETGIQERHLANYQITTIKMAPGAVTANVIASGNVTYDKIAWKKNVLLQMNVSSSDYPYPVVLPYNMDTKVRYIPEEIAEESQEVYVNGQLQFPGEDYAIERVIAAQHIDPSTTPPTVTEEYAYKITFQRDIPVNARVWVNYFLPVL